MKNIQEQFTPCEQSLKLKELGFDEECLMYYDENKIIKYCPHWFNNSNLINSDINISAPLWQQVFDWFREEYNIDSNIEPLGINKRFYSIYIVFKDNEEIKGDGSLYDKYEEAQLALLDKLIEIVEQQKK